MRKFIKIKNGKLTDIDISDDTLPSEVFESFKQRYSLMRNNDAPDIEFERKQYKGKTEFLEVFVCADNLEEVEKTISLLLTQTRLYKNKSDIFEGLRKLGVVSGSNKERPPPYIHHTLPDHDKANSDFVFNIHMVHEYDKSKLKPETYNLSYLMAEFIIVHEKWNQFLVALEEKMNIGADLETSSLHKKPILKV